MIFLENYIKTVLYAYPLLKTVEEDYAEHIKNKAILSYDSRWDAERLTEYLAEEILSKNHLIWLRSMVDKVMDRLSETERALLSIRYFGKARSARTFSLQGKEGSVAVWSERTYFRKQQRLGEKVAAMLRVSGVTIFPVWIFLRRFTDSSKRGGTESLPPMRRGDYINAFEIILPFRTAGGEGA